MAVTFPIPSDRITQESPEGTLDSKFAPFGASLMLYLGISVNEAMIRDLSVTFEVIAESAAKAITTQQKSLDSG